MTSSTDIATTSSTLRPKPRDMHSIRLRQFGVFFNAYYWQTAVLIARNGLARQYRNSFLGMFWTLLQPLTMVMVYSTIMPMIMRRTGGDNYTLHIVITLPLWAFFSSTLILASQSILSNGETLKRCMISSTVFPVADVLKNTYTLCISFSTMYLVAVLFGKTTLSPVLLLLPLAFLPVLVIMQAVCIGVAFIAPYVRDVGDLIIMAMTIIFWLTPIVYLPATLPPEAMEWMQWNPFYIMMHPMMTIAYDHAIPEAMSIVKLLLLMLVALAAGFSIFRLCRRNYVYYL
jgi:lipopolysaccharide transport system permease protein